MIYIKIVLVSLFVLFLQHALRIIYLLGLHVTVRSHAPGPCKLVPGVEHGSEDMETLPDGRTFITSGFLWGLSSSHMKSLYVDQGRKGKVLLFDFKTPEKGVTELELDPEFDSSDFRPHGISVIQNEDTGKITLFIVNHPNGRDTVEKFEFEPETLSLRHLKTFADENMRVINDVAATSENSFYVTNFGYSTTKFGATLETVLLLPWGNVLYYDGSSYRVVVDALVMANGIKLSLDKRSVYLAHGIFQMLNVYQRDDNDELNISQELPLYAYPDNILVDMKTGNLLIGSHPVPYQVTMYLDAPDRGVSPSQVLYIHMKNSSFAEGITELYSNEGLQISASSVASLYDNKMLVGTVCDKLLYCEVKTLE
ncbi:serum paraoxonase/arylesterase 1-like [Dreissena polymorpha]|uniref:Paraoxonase n=1 Tax=Dreissena polymorpha TaxID=45954 RepID=A0A9D4IZW6_DREPO|nr:serum paraoxonase/arylesterase 1-like [Dreissena polymorpha]KAH3790522.1 hypothetical protein DPMN_168724 [Dreissena polymorpha]